MFFSQHCVSWTIDTQYSFLLRVTVDKYTLSRLINLLLNEKKVLGLFPTRFLLRNNLVKVADSRSRSLNIINVIISGWIPPRKRVSGYGLSKKNGFTVWNSARHLQQQGAWSQFKTGSPLAQISLSDITGKINFKCLFLYPLRLLSILLHFRKITKKHDKNLISPTHY